MAKALILVHPGSMYGSAEFSLGKYEARAQRDGVYSELRAHTGPFIVIDGSLSDEIDATGTSLISDTIARCKAAGYPAYRLWGDDGSEEPFDGWTSGEGAPDFCIFEHQTDAGAMLAKILDKEFIVEVTGAWASYSGEEGCVNSVIDEFHAAGWSSDKARLAEYAVFIDDPDLDLEEGEDEPDL